MDYERNLAYNQVERIVTANCAYRALTMFTKEIESMSRGRGSHALASIASQVPPSLPPSSYRYACAQNLVVIETLFTNESPRN